MADEAGHALHCAVDIDSVEAQKFRLKDVKGKMEEDRATQRWNDSMVKVMQAAHSEKKITTRLALISNYHKLSAMLSVSNMV